MLQVQRMVYSRISDQELDALVEPITASNKLTGSLMIQARLKGQRTVLQEYASQEGSIKAPEPLQVGRGPATRQPRSDNPVGLSQPQQEGKKAPLLWPRYWLSYAGWGSGKRPAKWPLSRSRKTTNVCKKLFRVIVRPSPQHRDR
ncbi:uncharacterized protein [Littorina saxatilis]|uniref:uncharacterized protein isoform X2 n=1 Tax=Littorina saxatilis TaxID=31220 RepID=UPI0038B61DDF